MWKFSPIYKETVWGGSRIAPFKGDAHKLLSIGESWEVSGVAGSVSVVLEGPDMGLTLNDLVKREGDDLLGHDVIARFGNEFPLLVKLIDAEADLSVQVHPDDMMASRFGKNGKTEMWYVVDAQPGARLCNGFKRQLTEAEYDTLMAEGRIEDALNYVEIKPGDAFYIPAGRIHAIGAGAFIAEIQQTSDITYRVYDYNRRDAHGNLRELHVELAREALDLTDTGSGTIHAEAPAGGIANVVTSPFFTVNVAEATEPMTMEYEGVDSFKIYVAVEGDARIESMGVNVVLTRGNSVLLAASEHDVTITPLTSRFRFLETYISRYEE